MFFNLLVNILHAMQLVCRILFVTCFVHMESMLFKNCKEKTFLLLTETTGEISQTTLRSNLKNVVHYKNVILIL